MVVENEMRIVSVANVFSKKIWLGNGRFGGGFVLFGRVLELN